MFFNEFDPVKRNSCLPPVSKDLAADSRNFRASEIMSQFKEEDRMKEKSMPKKKSLEKLVPEEPPAPEPLVQKRSEE